jgi:exportin-T
MALCQNERHFLLFLKILHQINTEIADRELNKSAKVSLCHVFHHSHFVTHVFDLQETEKNTQIKDLMRETCMLDLAKFWFNIIPLFRDTCPMIVCLTLETIGAFVSWIDINLITNDCFIPMLFQLFEKPEFRCSVCDCLTGILHKGMDPLVKTQLVEQLMNVDAFKLRLQQVISRSSGDQEDEFVIKLSKLVNTAGIELIEAHKKTKVKVSQDASAAPQLAVISDAIESKLSLLYHFLSDKNDIVSLQIHPFAREYIQWSKNKKNSKSEIPVDKMKEMIDLFAKVVIEKSKYSPNYDFDCDDSTDFDECRKSCRILFENLMFLNANMCSNVVCDEITEPVIKNWRSGHSFPDVEVALYAFHLLGENMGAIADQKKLEQVLQLIVTSSVSSFPHHAVQLVYFEIIVRYDKFFMHSLSYLIPQILISFLDERGLKHANYKLRSKACHLFNKFIRSNIKGKGVEKIQSFFEDMLKRLQEFLRVDFATDNGDFVKQIPNGTPSPEPGLNEDDQLVLYETVVSLIVCNTSYEPVKKHLLLKSFLIDGLWNNFEKLYSILLTEVGNQPVTNGFSNSLNNCVKVKPEVTRICQKISHCIFLVARTTKAFSNAHPIKSIDAQSMYLASFNNFVKVLSLNVGSENVALLQSAIRQLLHRLIVCLDESEILPLLPVAIEKLFLPCSTSNANLRTVQELVPLINQVVTKFKHCWQFQRDLLPFLKQIFLPLVTSIFTLTSSPDLAADEVHSLQKCYYTFLSVMASNNIMDVFLDLRKSFSL